MTFRNRIKNSRAIMPVGMICLVIGILLPMLFHPASKLGLDLSHGVRGMLFGLSIVLNLWAARLASRQRRCGGS
jgi:hypothetical protein